MDPFILGQEATIRSIDRFVENFKKIGKTNWTHAKARNRLACLKDLWVTCQAQHAKLLEFCVDAAPRNHEYFKADHFTHAEDSYLAASDFIMEVLMDLEPKPSTSSAPPVIGQREQSAGIVQDLPPIGLPTFSGDYRDWESFRDRFTSLIIDRAELSDSRRMHYLASCVRGVAANSISTLPITNDSFNVAWNLLKSRFDNKRRLVHVQLETFYNLAKITSGSAEQLTILRDQTTMVINSLKNLGRPVQTCDDFIVFRVVQCLDSNSRHAWELKQGNATEYPTYETLDKFLESRIRALENIGDEKIAHYKPDKFSHRTSSSSSSSSSVQAHNSSTQYYTDRCDLCKGNHFLASCPSFKNKSPPQRYAFVKQDKRCLNCLSRRHLAKECSSQATCRRCQRRHHTLLHFEEAMTRTSPSSVESKVEPQVDTTHVNTHISTDLVCSQSKILLATAWIQACTTSGRKQQVRALLDQGSEATFISETLAQVLRVPRDRADVAVSGIGASSAGVARHSTLLQVESCEPDGPSYSTRALILPSLTKYAKPRATDLSTWSHIRGLKLADPDCSTSTPIQMIIGADLYGSLLREGIRQGEAGQPIAQNTIFGWVLSGPLSTRSDLSPSSVRVHFAMSEVSSLDRELRRFWEIEEIPQPIPLSQDDQRCEDHFRSTHSRTAEGRYVVRLPFKGDRPIEIGTSRPKANAILTRLTRQLQAQPTINEEYSTFLAEYEKLGHMELVSDYDKPASQTVYIPHQAVIRATSSTTKLRVVFNASCATSNGSSLNDHLLIGPKLQSSLPAIILKWRQWQYAYCADIAKMYRQILVHRDDVDFQRILWRPSSEAPVNSYRLLTVTYGTAPAPYLALRVLQQLADDEGAAFPKAVSLIRNNTYVDDCLFGADDVDSAINIRHELTAMLEKGGFVLRKWASNCPKLLEDISPEDHGLACSKFVESDDSLKILGISWRPGSDRFYFKVDTPPVTPSSKRAILSAIAKFYDPLGWATPVTIVAKMFMQRLWLKKCSWDERVPSELFDHWDRYYTSLHRLNDISLSRWTQQSATVIKTELHGFSDASSQAYAAVVYLRLTLISGQHVSSLLAAKSKVAPVKSMSIPRLELAGAALLSNLVLFVQSTLNLATVPCYCWTDSTVTLAWITQHPAKWKTFVANRVSLIQTQLPTAVWRHVPTASNPADCCSRGVSAQELASHKLWWEGPHWLKLEPEAWPRQSVIAAVEAQSEQKVNVTAFVVCRHEPWDLPNKFSHWPKLLRVTAYCFRFILHCRNQRRAGSNPIGEASSTLNALRSDEVKRAEIFWMSYIQNDLFPDEIADLKRQQSVSTKSSLVSLHPFLDDDGLIRVGGRLENSKFPFHQKHPIVLKSHALVTLLIRYIHMRLFHSGPQLTLSFLRQHYWILRARQVIRSVIHKCIACTRERATSPTQLMGNLPPPRVTPEIRPFIHCGVDYAGPILIRDAPGRGRKSHKAYIALFVCLTTRAVHLELVTGYASEAFLAAFDRFCSRRGLPTAMYSDNGTTFRGADRELTRNFRAITTDPNFLSHLATDQIDWNFIPPAAPHFGGLWEAGVRSVKHHLKRVVGSHTFTYEEFSTILYQTEACLNSRPIGPMSDCLDDYSALTPGHFLIGSALTTVPAPTTLELKESRLNRWQLVRRMYEAFWKCWSTEYIHTLQQRTKWRVEKDNVKPGCLVLLRNPLLPPCKWELGRITACHRGADDLVRVVTLKTAKSEYTRPISQICLLPVEAEDS